MYSWKNARSYVKVLSMMSKRIILVQHLRSAASDDPTVYSRVPDYKIELVDKGRMDDGWTYGPVRDDAKKQHPCLVPYADLPESEKDYDRATAISTLKLICKMGYEIHTQFVKSKIKCGTFK